MWILDESLSNTRWTEKVINLLKSVCHKEIGIVVDLTDTAQSHPLKHYGAKKLVNRRTESPTSFLVPQPRRGFREKSHILNVIKDMCLQGEVDRSLIICYETDESSLCYYTEIGELVTQGTKNLKRDCVLKPSLWPSAIKSGTVYQTCYIAARSG